MIRLSPSDQKLLDLFSRFEIMSSRQIRNLVYAKVIETNFFRRLRTLEKAKMIKRMGPMQDHSYAWMLGHEGKRKMGFSEKELFKTRLTLEHDVAVTEVRISLDLLGVGEKLIPERELRQKALSGKSSFRDKEKPVLVPDGLFPVVIKNEAKVIALEVELHFKNRHRYIELFKRYLQTNGIYAIWYVVPNSSLGDRLLKEWELFFEKFSWRYARNKVLCYSIFDEVSKSPHEAFVFDYHRKVKIGDWWTLPRNELLEKPIDHYSDQSLILELNEKNKAAS